MNIKALFINYNYNNFVIFLYYLPRRTMSISKGRGNPRLFII
ncbi:MAG: hypothetical protein YFSK_6100 [Candidatus Yanofskyibacterium parasiticum]|nr:MAG: hypothetical protein YFSK_6100 [Candidatus Yanofskybacteria bacterium]